MGFIEMCLSLLSRPEETVAAEKAKASFVAGLKNFAVVAAAIGFIIGLIIAAISIIAAPFLAMVPALQILSMIGLLAIIIVPIFLVIITLIASLVLNLLLWVSARLIGGRGGFGVQYYLYSVAIIPPALAIAAAYIVFLLLAFAPILNIAGYALLGFALGYLQIIGFMASISVLKQTHGFDTKQVATATGISSLIVMSLIAIFGLILAALLFGMR